MSPRPGGEADKFGNRYEGAWTIRHLLFVLAGYADAVTVEDIGELAQGVEFTFYLRDSTVEVHQLPRRRAQECSGPNEHVDPHLVAGFGDPAELEPEHRPDGTRDFRRLSGLLEQPLAALRWPGCDKPVWHCAVRAAPEDRMLSDAEWAQVAARVMHRTGLAPDGDDLGVRLGSGPA